MQVSRFSLGEIRLVRLKSALDFSRGKFLDLLRGATGEGAGVQKGIELIQDGREESSATDAVDQVVVFSLLLDVVCCLVGEDTCFGGTRLVNWGNGIVCLEVREREATYGFPREHPGGRDPSLRKP